MSNGWARLGIAVGGAVLGGWAGSVMGLTGWMGSAAIGVGFTAGTLLGTHLFPMTGDMKMPKIGGYPIQTSGKGQAIPIVYGTTRVAGNVIWMGPLQTVTIKHETGGGKGGGDTAAVEEIRYRRSFLIGVCEGERTIIRIWRGKTEIPLSSATLFTGDGNNTGLAALVGEDYASYKYLCCAFFNSFDLGNTQQIPNFVFEVTQITAFGGYYLSQEAVYQFDTTYKTQACAQPSGAPELGNVDVDDVNGRVLVSNSKQQPDQPWLIYNRDLSAQEDIEVGEIDGWPDWQNCLDFLVCFSSTGEYVYGIWRTNKIGSVRFYIAKWNSTTGALIWSDWHSRQQSWALQCDSYDNVFYFRGDSINKVPAWRDKDNVSEHLFSDQIDYCYRCLVVEDWQAVLFCGFYNPFDGSYQHVWKYDLPQWNGSDWDWDPNATAVAELGLSLLDRAWDMVAVDDYLYVLTRYGEIYQLDQDLNEVTHIARSGAQHLFEGPSSTVCVLYESASEAYIDVYDTDLNLLDTIKTEYEADHPGYTWQRNQGSIYSYYGAGGGDANPADIIWDLFTHSRYGAGHPVAEFDADSFAETRLACYVGDFLISCVINDRKPLPDWIEWICSHFQGFIIDAYPIGLGMFRDQPSQFALTQADLVRTGGEAPIRVRKRKYTETFNRIEIMWQYRDLDYADAVAVAKDSVDQAVCGHVRKKTIDLTGIHRPELAVKMVWRAFCDNMYRFGIYSFTVGYQRMLLQAGDVGTLSDGYLITAQKIRILSISEDKDGRGLAIEAVEDKTALYPDLANYQTEITVHVPDTAPTLADGTVAFRESENEAKLYLSITPGNQYANGWYIYRSYDDSSYELVGKATIAGVTGGDANSSGTLKTALAGGPSLSHRQVEKFQADIGTLTDLIDASDTDFFRGAQLAKVEDEIIAYRDVTDQGDGIWLVENLIRGMFHTERAAHAVGAAFATLDITFTYNLKESDIGKTLYFKVVTFYGRDNIQSLMGRTAFSWQVRGLWRRPAPVSLLRLTADENDGGAVSYSGASFTLYWNPASKNTGYNQGGYDVYSGKIRWRYGDDEAELLPGSGVAYGNYVADAELQAVDLIFEKTDGTPIGQRHLAAAATSAIISKADDLDNNNPAVVKVVPRRAQRSWREKSITVMQV